MTTPPPRSTRPDTLFPYPPLVRSPGEASHTTSWVEIAVSLAISRDDPLGPLVSTAARSRPGPVEFCARRIERNFLAGPDRSEEHTSELQSLMRISYAVFCLKKKKSILVLRLTVLT